MYILSNTIFYMKFKLENSFESRIQESSRVINKYPDRITVICEKINEKKNDIPIIDKKKYLVPIDLTIGQFLYVIRNRMKLSPEKAIFLFISNSIPPNSSMIIDLYSQYRDPDGFLYITYSSENVFG